MGKVNRMRPPAGTVERRVFDKLKSDKYGNWISVFDDDTLVAIINRVLVEAEIDQVYLDQLKNQIKELDDAIQALESDRDRLENENLS